VHTHQKVGLLLGLEIQLEVTENLHCNSQRPSTSETQNLSGLSSIFCSLKLFCNNQDNVSGHSVSIILNQYELLKGIPELRIEKC